MTRFVEFEQATLKGETKTVTDAGFRGGGLVRRAARRNLVARSAAGTVNFDPTTNGFGLFLQYMLGSSATPTSIGNGLYQQVHNPGSLNGKSFTTQIVTPDTTGNLAQNAMTYPGCKITDWALSVAADAQVKLVLTIDALDFATPSNGFASTTLSAAATQGATSISTVAAIPAGAYVTLDTGPLLEVVQTTGAATGTGPYVSTLVTATTLAHATGVYAGSATGVNYGAATALQTPSYNATTSEFYYSSGSLVAGGSTAITSGVFTNTGGVPLAYVRTVTVTGKNSLAVNRTSLGSLLRSEQLDNGWRDYTADVEVEFSSRAAYDRYAADGATALSLTFTGANGSKLSIYAPAAFQETGGQPDVSNADIITLKQKYTFLDDGTNGAIQVVYTSSDATL